GPAAPPREAVPGLPHPDRDRPERQRARPVDPRDELEARLELLADERELRLEVPLLAVPQRSLGGHLPRFDLHRPATLSRRHRSSCRGASLLGCGPMVADVYGIGELPPIGEVPPRMHAMLVRPDRSGEPRDAIQDEVIDVPELGPRDVLVATMAAGVNFN